MPSGHDLAMRLRVAYLAVHRRTNAVLAPLGLTADQFVVLTALAESEGVTQQRAGQQDGIGREYDERDAAAARGQGTGQPQAARRRRPGAKRVADEERPPGAASCSGKKPRLCALNFRPPCRVTCWIRSSMGSNQVALAMNLSGAAHRHREVS